jgi:hypothetical protein
VDLGFDDDHFVAFLKKLRRDLAGGVRRGANVARGDGDAVLGEELFGLKFVNVHWGIEFARRFLLVGLWRGEAFSKEEIRAAQQHRPTKRGEYSVLPPLLFIEYLWV